MNLDDLKSKITLEQALDPQRQALAAQALEGIKEGLARLATLGYRYSLVQEDQHPEKAEPAEYPKMLYRSDSVNLTVEDEEGENKARSQGYAGLSEATSQLPQPAVDSQPLNPSLAPPAASPKPPLDEKAMVEDRMERGVGASVPTSGKESSLPASTALPQTTALSGAAATGSQVRQVATDAKQGTNNQSDEKTH